MYNLLNLNSKERKINNSNIINDLIFDLCENSSPEKGLCFSDNAYNLMNKIKEFNYKNIYCCNRIKPSNSFFELVLNEIYNTLKSCYDGKSVFSSIKNLKKLLMKNLRLIFGK